MRGVFVMWRAIYVRPYSTGGKIAVTTAYSGFTSTLDITVWFPKVVRIYAQDDELNLITSGPTDFSGYQAPGFSCNSPMFQWTELMAIATFGGVGLVNVPDVEVTRLVTFSRGLHSSTSHLNLSRLLLLLLLLPLLLPFLSH